jgi:CAAX protease family protein
MTNTLIYKIIELLFLFLLIPLMLMFNTLRWINFILVILAVAYCIIIQIKSKDARFSSIFKFQKPEYIKTIILRFIFAAIISTIIMYILNRETLFSIVITNPRLWLMISIFYTIFSVVPQEFLYRTFFFKRYESILPGNKVYLIILNAAFFSIAHIFFKNILVIAITFAGGIIFALSYYKTRSLLITSIEHAVYGFWLFTLGAGEMLAFPGS